MEKMLALEKESKRLIQKQQTRHWFVFLPSLNKGENTKKNIGFDSFSASKMKNSNGLSAKNPSTSYFYSNVKVY